MSPAERDARIRELKKALRNFGPELEYNKRWSRGARFIGKPDRKRPAFRAYEERSGAYLKSKRNHDQLRAELLDLQAQARRRAQ